MTYTTEQYETVESIGAGWSIARLPFSAPLRDGYHYFGRYAGETYVGPCNTIPDALEEVSRVRAEIRPDMVGAGWGDAEESAEIERAAIIALARRLSDPRDFDAETSYNGPGRYEGTDDRALEVSLDVLAMHGCADETAGSTEFGLHGSRLGRFILWTDDRGFVSFERRADDSEASEYLAQNTYEPESEEDVA